jgi:hypothetical protein
MFRLRKLRLALISLGSRGRGITCFRVRSLRRMNVGVGWWNQVRVDGHAITEAGSCRISTAAAGIISKVKLCGICGGQSGTGAYLLRVFRFFLPILIPPSAPYSSIIRRWYNWPISGRRAKWTQSHPNPRNYKKKSHGWGNEISESLQNRECVVWRWFHKPEGLKEGLCHLKEQPLLTECTWLCCLGELNEL